MKTRKGSALLVLAAVLAALFTTCGLEDYYYLPPVPQSNVRLNDSTKVSIDIPGSYSSYSYFTGFKIFYRIYVSGMSIPVAPINTEALMNSINSALRTDYSAIRPSTDTTGDTANTSVGSLFSGRQYYELELDGGISISSELDSSCYGTTINFDFSGNPVMSVGSAAEKRLYRSTSGNVHNLKPDHYFYNTDDIRSSINAAVNRDVVTIGDPSNGTCVSLYIAATGFHPSNLTTIYSSPTFIGIFGLPNR